jgi:hypothetical protein
MFTIKKIFIFLHMFTIKKLSLLSFSIVIGAIACTPKTPTPPVSQVPGYVGTYVGKDSTITTNNGVQSSNVVNNSFVVIESPLLGKNAYLLGYQGIDTVKANITSNTIVYFDIGFGDLSFNGTYNGSNELTAFEEFTYLQVNSKRYGFYKKQ